MKKKLMAFLMVGALVPTCIGAITSVLLDSVRTNSNVARADNEDVTFKKIEWNNIDYLNLRPAEEANYIPQYGYCIMVSYSSYFNPVTTDNFAYTNLEYSSHILVCGRPINELEGSVALINSGNLFVYFKDSSIVYSDDCFRPTLEIEEGTVMNGLRLPYNRFEYKYSIGTNGKWENTTSAVRTNVSYTKIEWNNTHYADESYPALGAKNALLLRYSANLSAVSNENSNVYVQNRNLKNTVLGENISLNRTPLKDIDGAEIRYFNQNLLWIYAPNMTVPSGDRFAKLEILSSPVFDAIIPAKTLYFVGNKWVDNLQEATFDSIKWNNVDYSTPSILMPEPETTAFPQYGCVIVLGFVESLGSSSNTNMADEAYDIGSHLLINGVPCKDVSGAMVGLYLADTRNIYIYFPKASLSDAYERPIVEIESGCMIGNYLLPKVKIENRGAVGAYGAWQICGENDGTDNPFSLISWNNIDYHYGYSTGLLLSFQNNISNIAADINGGFREDNLKNTELGRNIEFNGTPLSEIDGAELKYFQQNHIWIYTPTMTSPSNGYKNPHISITRPTKFFDSIIPTLELVFKRIAWEVSDEDVLIRTSFSNFFEGHNNLDLGNTYRDTILCFEQKLYHDSSKNNTNLIATNHEFVNKATLNGVPLKNVPGIYVIYMGNQYIQLMIREVDEVPTAYSPATELYIPQDTHVFDYFLNETTIYLDSNTNQWVNVANGTIINTLEDATFKTTGVSNQITGMSFESRINKTIFDIQVEKHGIENISFGTYVLPKVNLENSSYSNPIEYINHNSPSNSTYIDIPNTNKDFTNALTAESDGYYRFEASMYNIKSSHYADGFIGIGYITIADRTFYGNVTDNATSFYDLLVQAYSMSLISSSYFDSVISFETTSNAYELTDVSVVSSGYSTSYASKGYYALSTTKDIKTIVIDGVPQKVNIRKGSSTYFAYYNDVVDFRTSLSMSKGIGEPVYELFPDNVNSNANLNTADNVSSLNQAFGSNAERIWVDLRTGLSADAFNMCDEDGIFQLDPTSVIRLHNYLEKFTSKGITELTLLVSGWAFDRNSPIFLKDGNWYNLTEIYALGGASPSSIVPAQTSETYQAWLDANESMAYEIAKEFPEFKYIEIANEIDGGGHKYSPDYITSEGETIPPIGTVAKWAMDLCHSLSKGVKKAGSHMRVMSPAFSCLDITAINPYNTKNFINNCYSYIESTDDPYTNNWFQVMNLHPYVFPTRNNTGADSVYLWEDKPYSSYGQRDKIDNTDYDDDWIAYLNYVHSTIMGSHHDAKKSIAITELGLSDMGGTTDSYWKYINHNDRFNTIATNIMNKINSVDYIETLIWFRLFDFAITDPQSAFGGCFEQNFGLIEENKTLKELGKKLYQLWNGGSTDYSDITSYLSTMEGRD